MNAKDFFPNQCSYSKKIEDFATIMPWIRIAIFIDTFIIEAIALEQKHEFEKAANKVIPGIIIKYINTMNDNLKTRNYWISLKFGFHYFIWAVQLWFMLLTSTDM